MDPTSSQSSLLSEDMEEIGGEGREDFKEVNAILPRNFRQSIKITMSDTIDFLEKKDEMMVMLTNKLNTSHPKNKYIFLDIILDNTENIGKKSYLCIFLEIPRLNLKLIVATIKTYNEINKSNINLCKFYVGLDKEDRTAQPDCSYNEGGGPIEDKVHIELLFNKSVSEIEIAYNNRDGIPFPYASNSIKISDLC